MGKRLTVSHYWLAFGVSQLAAMAGVFLAVFGYLQNSQPGIMIGGGVVVLTTIAHHVAAGWRCRDIGWWVGLPWVVLAGTGLAAWIATSADPLTALTLGASAAFADIVFLIVIGCLPTSERRSRQAAQDDAPGPVELPVELPTGRGSPLPELEREDRIAREDAAIQRALEAYREQGSEPVAAPVRAPQGFGRKRLAVSSAQGR